MQSPGCVAGGLFAQCGMKPHLGCPFVCLVVSLLRFPYCYIVVITIITNTIITLSIISCKIAIITATIIYITIIINTVIIVFL